MKQITINKNLKQTFFFIIPNTYFESSLNHPQSKLSFLTIPRGRPWSKQNSHSNLFHRSKNSLFWKKISFIDHSIEYEYLLLVPNERMEKSINNRRYYDKRLIETRGPSGAASRRAAHAAFSRSLTDAHASTHFSHTSVPSNRSTIAPAPFSAAFSFHRYSCLAYTGCWYIFGHAFQGSSDRGKIQKLVDLWNYKSFSWMKWSYLFKLNWVLFNLNRNWSSYGFLIIRIVGKYCCVNQN